MGFQLRSLVNGDRTGHDWTRHSACTAQRLLGTNENVRNVFVFAQQWQMQKDFQWFRVGSHHNEFGQTSVQCLGRFVGTFLQLVVVQRLLQQIHDFGRQHRIGQRIRFLVNFFVGLRLRVEVKKKIEVGISMPTHIH